MFIANDTELATRSTGHTCHLESTHFPCSFLEFKSKSILSEFV